MVHEISFNKPGVGPILKVLKEKTTNLNQNPSQGFPYLIIQNAEAQAFRVLDQLHNLDFRRPQG